MQNKTSETEKAGGVYPYGPISTCLAIAEAVNSLSGGGKSAVSKSLLASHLGEDERSQGLLVRMASAKSYGMIEGRTSFVITDLGKRLFSGDARRATLEAFESPPAFKMLIERFDGSKLPAADTLGKILNTESGVPESWKDRVAGFFLRSAVQAGAIDEQGHLRVRASKESLHTQLTAVPENGGHVVRESTVSHNTNQNDRKISVQINENPETFMVSRRDSATGRQQTVFAEVPRDLSYPLWKLLDGWVQSIKPEEEIRQV